MYKGYSIVRVFDTIKSATSECLFVRLLTTETTELMSVACSLLLYNKEKSFSYIIVTQKS